MSVNKLHPLSSTEFNFDTPNREMYHKDDLINTTHRDLILGRGSFGLVVKGVYKDKPVAVKILEKCQQHKFESLNNETNILEWHHKNIVRIIKIINEPQYGLGYVIMELYDGQTLQNIVEQFVIPLYHRLWILLDVTSALHYCHSHGVIHLDVKPQNIIVVGHGSGDGHLRRYVCKLCDFGSSVKVNAKLSKRHQRGTIRYMAPEVLRSSNITCAADVYALGISMWQIKENKIPFQDIESNDIVAYAVVKNNLRPDSIIGQVSPFKLRANNCRERVRKSSIRSTDLKIEIRNPDGHLCWLEDKENLGPDEKICSSPEILMEAPIFFSKNLVQSKNLWRSSSKVKIQIEREPSFLELFGGRHTYQRTRKLSETFDAETLFEEPWLAANCSPKENKYVRLYKDCWQKVSEMRPSTELIIKRLNNLFL